MSNIPDPEAIEGWQSFYYPQLKVYSFGVNVHFLIGFKRKMKMRRTIIYSLCCASLLLSSCDLDVPVTDRLPDEEVWKDDNLITGVFS